jgi:hypothetical protein
MKIRPVGAEPFLAGGQKDAHEVNSLVSQFLRTSLQNGEQSFAP